MSKPPFRYVWKLCVFVGLFFSATTAQTQNDLFVQFISTTPVLPYFSASEIKSTNPFFLNITAVNPDPTARYVLSLEIHGPGIHLVSTESRNRVYDVSPGGILTLLSSDIAPFFDLDQFQMDGLTAEEYIQSGLPDGTYRVCFQMMDVAYDRAEKVSNASCQVFVIRKQLPPVITYPKNNHVLDISLPAVFTWNHQAMTNEVIQYEFSIFEHQEGVTTEELLTFFQPVLQETSFSRFFTYTKNRFELKPGKKYIAFTRAIHKGRQILFHNNGYSQGVPFTTKGGTDQGNRATECPEITCDFTENGGVFDIVISLTGGVPGTYYDITLDNVFYGTSNQNPIIIPNVSLGLHTVLVGLPDICYDECTILVEGECQLGMPCNDNNPCTSGETYSAQCDCTGGVPTEEVSIEVGDPVYHFTCDYCVDLLPSSYGDYLSFNIEQIQLTTYWGQNIILDQSDNGLTDFHFPYQIEDLGITAIQLLVDDLNQWIALNDHQGTISPIVDYYQPCNTRLGLLFTDVNIGLGGLPLIKARSNTNVEFDIVFNEINCDQTTQIVGYYLNPLLEEPTDCILSAGNVDWSGGMEYDGISIFTQSLDHCYELTVTCKPDCDYTAVGPSTTCECTIGDPCTPAGPVNPCLTYAYNENCECEAVDPDFPDTDNDGVCDLVDICPGYNDLEDEDLDGIPDGCDLCPCDDDVLTPEQIALLTDNDPANDAGICDACPCDDAAEIQMTSLGHADCDYCLDASVLAIPQSATQLISSYQYMDNDGLHTVPLLNNWIAISEENFEAEEISWVSNALPNGEFCDRYEDYHYAGNGEYSMRFRNNGVNARMTSPALELASACLIRFSFSFISSGFDNAFDDLKLLMSVDGGAYNQVQVWEHTTHFQNEIRQYVDLYIPATGSNNTKFRFLCDATSPDDAIFVDDIRIYAIHPYEVTGACISTSSLTNVTHYLVGELARLNETGAVSYFNGTDGICGDGAYIIVENSTLGFESISFTGSEGSSTLQFNSPDCGDLYPGQELYELTVVSACEEATYLWNTGANTQNILIPSLLAGYIVSITCDDGCEYIETYGNQNCIVGEPCTIENNPCFVSGTNNEFCECVPPEAGFPDNDGDGIPNLCDDCPFPPDYDGDNDGIPDCEELECPCDVLPELILTEIPGQLCNSCFPLILDPGELLQQVTVYNPAGTFDLHTISGFNFPYCATQSDNEACQGDHPSLKQFRRDFVAWAYGMGWEIRMIFENNGAGDHCTPGPMFYIENLKGATTFDIRFDNHVLAGTSLGCVNSEAASTYSLSVVPSIDCEVCNTITSYKWSDPYITGNVSTISPVYPEGGYEVTITCDAGCEFVLRHEGNCLVGTPCNDLDPCTTGDHYDEHCFCVGDPGNQTDLDGDGVFDLCDVCPGFPDHIDDDHDGVPNACDECMGHDDALLHDGDPGNDPTSCIECTQLELDLFTSQISLTGWSGCGSNVVYAMGMNVFYPGASISTSILFSGTPGFQPRYCVSGSCPPGSATSVMMAADIKTWLLAQGDNPDVITQVVSNTLSILHSTFKFEKIRYLCGGPTPLYKDFTNTVEEESYPVPSPCDDGDICTIGDHWNELCQCVGTLVDTDGDNVPDCDDLCPGQNDFWDENGNGIPDCSESVMLMCDGQLESYCSYYSQLLEATYVNENGQTKPVVTRLDQLSNYDPRVISISLQAATIELIAFLESVDWQPLNFNYPTLITQLQSIAQNPSNDFNQIPAFIDPFNNAATDGYLTTTAWTWACTNMTQEQRSLIIRLTLQTVNDISDPNEQSFCYMDGETPLYTVYPGCATALGIPVYEDANCIMRRSDTHCPIEFIVDCDGSCDFILTEILFDEVPPPGSDCGSPGEPVIGTPCTKTPESCALDNPGMPCAVWQVVPNPAYNITTNPDVTPCLCEALTVDENSSALVGDLDGDGICDDLDQCANENDDTDANGDPDNDDDGIHDCQDSCPNLPGVVGDYCDDEDPMTFGSAINQDCSCEGHYIDWDGDGVPEISECNGTTDDDVDGYPDGIIDIMTIVYNAEGLIIDMVPGPDGLPDCDVCPGLDDTELNSDGIPVCLAPPHTPIGCPVAFHLVHHQGIVLVYNSDEITAELIPQPISVLYEVLSGATGSEFKEYPYLLYTEIRETAGQFEVLYSIPDLYNLVPVDLGYVSITYADHQQCVLLDHEPDFVSLGCPDLMEYFATTQDLVLTFEIGDGLAVNEEELEEGTIAFLLISPEGEDLTDPADPSLPLIVEYTEGDVNYNQNTGEVKITLPFEGLADMATYSGTITMQGSGAVCEFNLGDLVRDCEDDQGEPVALGEPCDDMNPCTEFDAWGLVEGICACVGEPKPDADGDGICDDQDPGLSDLMCPSELVLDPLGNLQILFTPPAGYNVDPHSVTGELVLHPSGGSADVILLDIEMADFFGNLMAITLVGDHGISSPSTFAGTITLPNTLECTYGNGEMIPDCPDGIMNGDPCDDGEVCTHHDKYVDCECVGEENGSDTDGDGICDVADPCPVEDCPCEQIAIQEDPEAPGEPWVNVINGNEVEVMLVEEIASSFQYLNIHITGGEEDIELTMLPYSSPLIIPNLPYGYYYVITITGVCLSGEENDVEIEVDVPLAEGQFVCGIEIKDIDLATQNLLPILEYGDVFTASDFNITVKNANGSLGKFTGSGYIKIPYFQAARINVSFANILISADKQMIQGVINVNGFGLAVLGDELSDLINEAVNDILNVLEDIDEILDALIPLLEEIDELVATTGQMVPPEIKECLEKAKKAMADYLATNPDKNLQATKDKIIELTEDIDDCMDQYNVALAAILGGLIEFFPYYIERISTDNTVCNLNQLEIDYETDDQKYKEQFITARSELVNGWMSGAPGQEVVDGKIRFNESLPTPSFEMSGMDAYYIDHILQYDFCNALINLDIGFSDPNITPEIMTARIKVLTGLILELDSQVLNNLGIDITDDLSKEELFDKYHTFVSNAFKNILIRKAYKR